MTAYIDTFERKEMKYRLDAGRARVVAESLRGRMVPDSFGKSQVTSVYYDTPERSLIARSLEKPLYKEKLRVRWYGGAADVRNPATCAADLLVFTELKKKFKGVVYKRRVGTSAAAACAWAQGMPYAEAVRAFPLADAQAQAEAASAASRQIAREIDAMRIRSGRLAPSVLITCARTAFTVCDVACDGPGGSTAASSAFAADLRVTFDEDLRGLDLAGGGLACSLEDALALSAADLRATCRPLIDADESIMEVKSSDALPLWLVRALSAAEAYPSSFSKYGELYRIAMDAPAAVRASAPAAQTRRAKHARCGAPASQKHRKQYFERTISYA